MESRIGIPDLFLKKEVVQSGRRWVFCTVYSGKREVGNSFGLARFVDFDVLNGGINDSKCDYQS